MSREPVVAPAPRVRRVRVAAPGKSTAGLLAWGLAPDVVQDAARRLGAVGVLFAAANALGLAIGETFRAISVSSEELRLERNTAEILGIGLGIAAFLLARRARWSPVRLIAAGLLFEWLAGFLIVWPEALQHVTSKLNASAVGVSWLAVWIAIYPVVLPASPLVTMLSGLITASMAPLAFGAATLGGRPWPDTSHMIFFLTPCYMMAVLTFLPAMLLHRMRSQVSEARALGGYRLEERLGSGGMGEVWRASHHVLARPAAIKLIGGGAAATASPQEMRDLQRRFELEAQATASLSSPHTVALYDFGTTDDGRFFYVMELLDGLDFDALVKHHGAMPPERVVHLLLQACESLEEAHGRGLVHRDVKPSNLYACRIGGRHDFVKVLDFGLVSMPAALRSGDARLTDVNAAIGTPGYMAPEVVLGGTADRRVDLYGMGCVAYWLLAGREVFTGRSAVERMSLHAHGVPEPPSRHAPEVPAALDAVVLGCLEKDPARRPPSAGDLAERLASVALPRSWTRERADAWWRSVAAD